MSAFLKGLLTREGVRRALSQLTPPRVRRALLLLVLTPVIAPAQNRADAIWDTTYSFLERRMDQCYHAGLYEECLTFLRAMQGMEPDEPELSNLVAWMHGNLGRPEEEMAESLRFYATHPSLEAAAYQLGQVLMQKKLYARIPAILMPFAQGSKLLGTYVMLSKSYEEMGLLTEALHIWEIRENAFPGEENTRRNIERLKKKLADG